VLLAVSIFHICERSKREDEEGGESEIGMQLQWFCCALVFVIGTRASRTNVPRALSKLSRKARLSGRARLRSQQSDLRTDYGLGKSTSMQQQGELYPGGDEAVIAFVETSSQQRAQFIGDAISAVGGAMGGAVASNTASQKENCVGCKFVWKKIHAGLDQSAGYDTVKNSFERVCMNMPDVFYDVCDTMYDQESELVQDYLQNMDFTTICENAGLCWAGLCVPKC